VVLNREGEGDEDVVAPDEHEAEVLGHYVPRIEHFRLVDEVIPDVPRGDDLVQYHARREVAHDGGLFQGETYVDEEPAGHGGAIREELEVYPKEGGVKRSTHDEILV